MIPRRPPHPPAQGRGQGLSRRKPFQETRRKPLQETRRKPLQQPWLAALLAMVIAVSGLGVISPVPAAADEAAGLTVTLRSVSPASGTRNDTIALTGTVTNETSAPVSDLQVHLWRSTDVVEDEASLEAVLATAPETPLGRRMISAEAGNIFNITDVGDQPSQAFPQGKKSFAPGETAAFSVRAKVSGDESLGFDSPGAYLVGVQLRGIPDGGQNQTVGRARSLFVLAPDSDEPRPRAASTALVHMTTRPSLVGGTVFQDDHLAAELRGRLRLLLALGQTPGTTLLVDPALVDHLSAMARGYTVQGSQEATAAGQRSAKEFLDALTPLLRQGRAYRTLYGSPDIALAVGSGRPDLVARAATPVPKDHLLAGLPLAVVPSSEGIGAREASVLSTLKPSLLVLQETPSDATVQDWPASSSTTVVRARTDVFEGGPAPAPVSAAQVTGRLQATQFVAREPVVTLVSASNQSAAELAAAPWRTRTPLATIVADAEEAPRWTPATKVDQVDDPAWMEAMELATAELDAWDELVDQESTTQQSANGILPQAISTNWQRRRPQAMSWLSAVQNRMGGVLDTNRISLHVVEDFVTSAPEQEIPVTIRNGLSEPIRVKVDFTSDNPQRISVSNSAVHRVAPGESATVKVSVVTHANGAVGMTARLTTVTGRPIGQPRPMTVTATQMGRVGWIIIIASGVVFLTGTAARIRQVQRERRGSTNVEAT
ncbi:DUF6049 family protein [Luteococcus sp. Sow4_B9]|uniref:DUF6049 family protein n=1 Tax=Luteococcus sp. Sow4_B9 TaxID=3438792 RepID=UPI003F9C383E